MTPTSKVGKSFSILLQCSHRCTSLFLSCFFFVSLSAQTPVDPVCAGDINLDGSRGTGDLALLSAHISGEMILEGPALANADVNFDFVVDVADLARLLQHNTGEFLLTPCGDFEAVEVVCPDLSLDNTSAAPLEEVGIGVLPEDFIEPILAVVTEENNEIGIVTFVERLEDGTARLFTPFYPGSSLEGGNVKLQVTDGFVTCPLVDFSIDSIPAVPGEFSRMIGVLQEDIRSQAAEFGLTVEDLVANNTQLPRQAIPLAAAQRLLDHPENPDSLRAMSEGTAPFLEGASDNTMLDGILGHLKVEELLGQTSPTPSEAEAVVVSVDLPGCGESAESLDNCMRQAALAERDLNPPDDGPAVEQLKRDVAQSMAALKVFPVTRRLVEFGEETVSSIKKDFDKVFPIVGLVLLLDKWADEAAASLLPSSFTSLDANLLPAVMEEDLELGEWSALAIATSKGWKLDGRRVFKYLFQQLNAKKILKTQVKKGVDKAFELTDGLPFVDDAKVQEKLINFIVNNITNTITNIAPDAFKGVALFEVEPELFGPVEISDQNWSAVDIRGAAVEEFNHDQYRPLEVGRADIIVRVRTDGGRFGGAPSISTLKAVEVKPIDLEISPDRKVLEPQERIVFFTVTVRDSAFPEQVEVLNPPAGGQAEIEYLGESQHRVTYEAPDPVPPNFVDTVTVRHTATTGARGAAGAPERTDQAEIRGSEVQVLVTPTADCVDVDTPSDPFTAQVIGLENQQVIWSASSGDISQSGVFQSDSPQVNVLITATSVENPEIKGQAVVKVGGCGCWWTVTLGDRIVSGTPGVDTADFFPFFTAGEALVELNLTVDETGVSMAYDPTQQRWSVAGRLGLESLSFDGDDLIPVQFLENSPNVVDAAIAGVVTMRDFTEEGDIEIPGVPFSAVFRIENDPEYVLDFAGCFVQ